jgi:hypothetical protein
MSRVGLNADKTQCHTCGTVEVGQWRCCLHEQVNPLHGGHYSPGSGDGLGALPWRIATRKPRCANAVEAEPKEHKAVYLVH